MAILQKIATLRRQIVRSIQFFKGFFVQDTAPLRRMSRPDFGRSAGFQPASTRQDGGAGNPEPEFDPPCTEGRADEKNALEDRVSRLLGPPREKPVMPQLDSPRRECRKSSLLLARQR